MQAIIVTIKLVVFRIHEDSLLVYLLDKKLPSKMLDENNSLDGQIADLFTEHFGFSLGKNYIEQLYTTSDNKNSIALVYYVLLSKQQAELSSRGDWKEIKHISKNASDEDIILYAQQRLQWKVEYTNVVYSLLPQEFTLSELQQTYETILNKKLDKRNFRKKMLTLQFLKKTGEKRRGVARPALLYTFKYRKPIMIKIFS